MVPMTLTYMFKVTGELDENNDKVVFDQLSVRVIRAIAYCWCYYCYWLARTTDLSENISEFFDCRSIRNLLLCQS